MEFTERIAKTREKKELLKEVCKKLNERAGIYMLTRFENGFKFAYIGQAKHLLSRLAQHLVNGDVWSKAHIDRSLKKHGLFSEDNQTGWKVDFIECEVDKLNDMERKYIYEYANMGYQLRNKTNGGQNSGKFAVSEYENRKGYKQGVEYGKTRLKAEIKTYFDKYLDFVIKGKENKLKLRKFEEFKKFLEE